jgi:hypothetical protein
VSGPTLRRPVPGAAPPAAPGKAARTATTIGIPVYTVLGAVGLWAGSAAWGALAASLVEDPTLLGGPKVAAAVASAFVAVVGVAAVALAFARSLARAGASSAGAARASAVVCGGVALVPGVLVALGSGHPGPGAVLALLALVLPAVLTGAITATLLPAVARSLPLTVGFRVAAAIAEVVVIVWAAVAFTPLGG